MARLQNKNALRLASFLHLNQSMGRSAGQSAVEFMLMIILLIGMAALLRTILWGHLPVLYAHVVHRVAVDGEVKQ